tara:strand:+ start:808 stop:1005 length:198 start_codon:yes stop_codon:yes gene_type:complete
MAKGYTRELSDWNGKTGKCIQGHELEILSGGYGLCEQCLHEIQGYSDLYIPPKGYVTPGDEYESG